MERRFTVKDMWLFGAIAALFILILITMYMIDRQWMKMAEIQSGMQEQGRDIQALRGMLREDAQAASAQGTKHATSTDTPVVAPIFQRAYAQSQAHDYAEGDWLVQELRVGLKTLTPLVSTGRYAKLIQGYVLESLLARDPQTLAWRGLIARDWDMSEQGRVMTFRLREDVYFSDGHPLSAEDVVFSFNFIMNEKIAAPRERAYLEKIEHVSATGPYEVVFKFKEPYFNNEALAGAMAILPKHVYAPYLEKPQEFNESTGLLMGSGPYRLRQTGSWSPDKGLVELERNPRYWGDVQPSFKRLLWKVIPNDNARLTAFRNGEIDTFAARPQQFERLLQDKRLGSRVQTFDYMSPIIGYAYIAWNQQRSGRPTPFADKRVRQAMTYLSDRRRIIDEIYFGYGETAVGPFNPRTHQHDPALVPRSYDIGKAQALLREAGFEDRNGDGVLEDAQDRVLEFELAFSQSNEDIKRMVILLRDLYARAGVRLKPKPVEWAVLLETLRTRDFDAVTLGWAGGIETDIYQMFHSSQTLPGADNYVGYKNATLDALIEQARITMDEDKRMDLWRRCERILYEDQPYTFLYRGKSLILVDDRIRNLHTTALGLNLRILPMEIYVPAARRRYTR